MAGLPPEERCEQRLARSKPVMDALLTWAETKSAAVPKSALGKALYYLREQWPYLIRFVEDGRLEIFNNRAERSVKPFVMSRKN
ncbi:IS66 family transposase [Dysosmobacter welbionis]